MEAMSKVRSMRISDEVNDKLKALVADFPNQNEMLSSLIATWELSQAKAVLTDRATEIADVQSHLQSIQSAFVHSLELTENAENRIRQEFRAMLDSKDRQIIELQTQIDQLKGSVASATNAAAETAEHLQVMTLSFQKAIQEICLHLEKK